MNIKLLIALCLLTSLSGCQTVFQSIYGIRTLRPLTVAELRSTATRYGIPAAEVVALDTSYRTLLVRTQRQDSLTAKNHYQPLQASYYNAAGQLQVFHVNCYAGGFPNLQWQARGAFNQFPPAPQAPIDTLLPLTAYLRYLRTPEGEPLSTFHTTDHTILVQWSQFMGRQSRRLIELVQQNASLARHQGQTVRLLFVNNDNLEVYLAKHQKKH